ncbi:Ger(x)C family spore germination C-terminal domain-containing protein [Ureibacillus sp. FSL W8-0352]|uniref:Ger(x)C family spore germination C-terminal domain-containing protein n=1 Tax=Ureibacillus sp. FSL W8-0352 TaxID=2954596 RepID=UPI0030FB67C0
MEKFKKYEVLNKFHEETSDRIEKIVKNTIDKIQNDFQTDAMGLGEYLNRYYPKIWKEVQDEWDNGKNYFSKSDIDCEVKIVIEEPGSINKTTSK